MRPVSLTPKLSKIGTGKDFPFVTLFCAVVPIQTNRNSIVLRQQIYSHIANRQLAHLQLRCLHGYIQ